MRQKALSSGVRRWRQHERRLCPPQTRPRLEPSPKHTGQVRRDSRSAPGSAREYGEGALGSGALGDDLVELPVSATAAARSASRKRAPSSTPSSLAWHSAAVAARAAAAVPQTRPSAQFRASSLRVGGAIGPGLRSRNQPGWIWNMGAISAPRSSCTCATSRRRRRSFPTKSGAPAVGTPAARTAARIVLRLLRLEVRNDEQTRRLALEEAQLERFVAASLGTHRHPALRSRSRSPSRRPSPRPGP